MKKNMGSIDKLIRSLSQSSCRSIFHKSNHWNSSDHSGYFCSRLFIDKRNRVLPVVSAAETFDYKKERCLKEASAATNHYEKMLKGIGILGVILFLLGSPRSYFLLMGSIAALFFGLTDFGRQCPLILSVQHHLNRRKSKKQSQIL